MPHPPANQPSQEATTGRICLLKSLKIITPKENKYKEKVVLMTIMGVVVLFIRDIYHVFCVKRKMSGLCPASKMSCIGKYLRNVIDWKETIYFYVYFCLGALVNLFCVQMFNTFETILQSEMIFSLSTLFWVTLLELPLLYLTIKLNIRGIPSVKVVLTPTEFYVLKPSFEPRKVSLKTTSSSLAYSIVPCPNVFGKSQDNLEDFILQNCEKNKTKSKKKSSLEARKVHGELPLLQTINTQNIHMGKGKSKGKSIGKGKGKITPSYVSPMYQSS